MSCQNSRRERRYFKCSKDSTILVAGAAKPSHHEDHITWYRIAECCGKVRYGMEWVWIGLGWADGSEGFKRASRKAGSDGSCHWVKWLERVRYVAAQGTDWERYCRMICLILVPSRYRTATLMVIWWPLTSCCGRSCCESWKATYQAVESTQNQYKKGRLSVYLCSVKHVACACMYLLDYTTGCYGPWGTVARVRVGIADRPCVFVSTTETIATLPYPPSTTPWR